MSFSRRVIFILIAVFLAHSAITSWAAKPPILIRDAEVENTIRSYATPLFRAAGLKNQDIKIYIVKDETLNAFVAGGQNIFINTGLILNADNANQIIGVIAHETGHIASRHLSRTHDALAKRSAASVLSLILGGAAVLATGRGDIGAAIISGGQTAALRNFLAYSRVQEAAADHAAFKYLDQTKQSARGMLGFMEKLGDQDLLSPAQQDPYVRSHPLTRERIDTIAHHVANSPHSDVPTPGRIIDKNERIKAKLHAFINPMSRTRRIYKEGDNSLYSRYARAIGHFRERKLELALPLIDGLIAEERGNPYFHELKGQMLFENAQLVGALSSYSQAARLLPDSALILRDLARVQLEMNDSSLIDNAIINLEASLSIEPRSAFSWRLLATAHGRKGDQGRSSIALAEEALLKGRPKNAEFHAGRALKLFLKGSREWLQAEDIRIAAKDLSSQQRRN